MGETRRDYLPGMAGSKKRGEIPKTEAEQNKLAKELKIESLTGKGGLEKHNPKKLEEKKLESKQWEGKIAAARKKIEEAGASDDAAWHEAKNRAEFKHEEISEEEIDSALNNLEDKK